eukprot:144867_1
MGPVLQRKAVNIAPNTTTFQILADYHPFTMDQAMERGRCSSDDAVYRYKSKTDIKNITASSSITSIQSQCDALNKMMFDELHSIKLNQQQFSKQLRDLQASQHVISNTLLDVATTMSVIHSKVCAKTPEAPPKDTFTINEDYATDDDMNTPNPLLTLGASSIIIHDTPNCMDTEEDATIGQHSVNDDNKSDAFLDDAAIETMHSLFKQKMKETETGKRDSNPFGHRQNLSDVFERNIDQFMLLLKSHEREKEKLEHEKMVFQLKLKDLHRKIESLDGKSVSVSVTQTHHNGPSTTVSDTNKSTKSIKSHNDLLSPRHRNGNEFVSKTSFHSTSESLQYNSPRYSVTKSKSGKSADHINKHKKKSNEIMLNNKKERGNHDEDLKQQMMDANACDLVDFEVEESTTRDNQNEGDIENRSRGTVHEFVTKYNVGTNRNHSHSNYTQTATATFIDPRGLSYRYLSSPPQSIDDTMNAISDEIHDLDAGQHHFYPPPTHNFNDNVQKYKMIALKQSKTDQLKYDDTHEDELMMIPNGGNSTQSSTKTESRNTIIYNGDNTCNLRINAQGIRSNTERGDITDTPLSHAMSTPTTNTYVYHANAPRLIDIDNDPFGCALDDASDGDGESLMIETINNAQKHLLSQQQQQQPQSNENDNGDGHSRRDTLNTLQTPMPHNIDSLCFDNTDMNKNGMTMDDRVQSMHIPSPKHRNNTAMIKNIGRRHRSTIPQSQRVFRIYHQHHTPPPHNHNHAHMRHDHKIYTPPPPHPSPLDRCNTMGAINNHQTVSLTASSPFLFPSDRERSDDTLVTDDESSMETLDIKPNKNGRRRRRKRQRINKHKAHPNNANNKSNNGRYDHGYDDDERMMNTTRSYHSHPRSDRSSTYNENSTNRHPHSHSVKTNRVVTINRANSANSSCLKHPAQTQTNTVVNLQHPSNSKSDTSPLSRNLACSVNAISPKSEISTANHNNRSGSANESSYYSNTTLIHNVAHGPSYDVGGQRWGMNSKSKDTNDSNNSNTSQLSSTSKSDTDSSPPQFIMPNIAQRSPRTPTTPKTILNNLLKLNQNIIKQASSRSIQTIRSFRDEKQQRKQSTVSIHRKQKQQKQSQYDTVHENSASKPILQKNNFTCKTTRSDLTPRTGKLKKCNSTKTRKKYKKRHSQRQLGKKCKKKNKYHHESRDNTNDHTHSRQNNDKVRRIQSNSPKTNHHRRSRRESTQKVEKRGIVKKFKKVFEK